MKQLINRKKKAGRIGWISQHFEGLKPGEMKQFPLSEVNISSFRARATRYNMEAGYTKFSIAVSIPMGILAIIYNE